MSMAASGRRISEERGGMDSPAKRHRYGPPPFAAALATAAPSISSSSSSSSPPPVRASPHHLFSQQQQYSYSPSSTTQMPLHGSASKTLPGIGNSTHHGSAPSSRYHPRATIIIIGMRGAGKTTLGLIADRALGKSLIDADQSFTRLENRSGPDYIRAHGFPAFREKEMEILKDLLAKYPHDGIIACGAGVVESEESRKVLSEAAKTMPVINILRAPEDVLAYLQLVKDAELLPEYGEPWPKLLERRARLYRQCATHTFANLSCDEIQKHLEAAPSGGRNGKASAVYPLKFKQVGESFLRLVRHILGDARRPHNLTSRPSSRPNSRAPSPGSGLSVHHRGSISHLLGSHGPGPDTGMERYSPSIPSSHFPCLPRKADPASRASLLTRRTTAISLTFPDLSQVEPALLKEVMQGVDAVEVRVDLLDCLKPASNAVRASNPQIEPVIDFEEVATQLEIVRKMAPGLPILFTVRSDREGGHFFDDRNRHQRHMASPHSQSLYFRLLELAIATGAELLDVEMGWEPDMTRRLIENRERTKIVVSYHDLPGALRWDSDVPMKLYQRAARDFGTGVHLVELIGTVSRAQIEQNSHLSSFAARTNSQAAVDPSSRTPPLMALNRRLAGRSSRTFNDVLGFISHPSLPTKADPGQMSLKETMETLVRFGVYQPCYFHLVERNEEARRTWRALQISFEELGLPYHLHSWSISDALERYLRDNKDGVEGAAEWQGEAIDDYSSGLFLGQNSAAEEQKHLFDLMDRRHSTHLTLAARVVRGVDILARQDISQSLLGTEQGRRVPNALGDVRGPLIGCHTLPSAIYRVLKAHTAPINAPGAFATALIVILKSSNGTTGESAATDVATRSALFALAKSGFGEVQVLEEERKGVEGIISEVLHLIRHSSNDALDETPFEQTSTEANRCHFSSTDVQQLSETERYSADPIRKPRAILLIGSDEAKQETALSTLRKTDAGDGDGLVLPRETWDTFFGGTILRIPSSSLLAFGERAPVSTQEVEAGVTWERGGWINVAPWVLERNRVHTGVVEAWSRRGAPVQSMQSGWEG